MTEVKARITMPIPAFESLTPGESATVSMIPSVAAQMKFAEDLCVILSGAVDKHGKLRKKKVRGYNRKKKQKWNLAW